MDQAKAFVKNQMEFYLRQKGLNPKKPFNCLNPDHADKNPSMSLDRRRNKVHCFACGVDYDVFDLVGLDCRLTDPAEIFQRAYEIFGVEPEKTKKPVRGAAFTTARVSATPAVKLVGTEKSRRAGQAEAAQTDEKTKKYLDECRGRLAETDYPAQRGLSRETCERFGLGFDPAYPAGGSGKFWPALIIPTGPNSFTARNTDPEADKSARIRKKGASPVFNAAVLWDDEVAVPGGDGDANRAPVVIVEGEIDALAVFEAGGRAVALGSTANVGAFLNLVQARPPSSGKPLILALDNDPEGERAADRLEEGLVSLATPFLRHNPWGSAKDAAEALVADPSGLSGVLAGLADLGAQQAAEEKKKYLGTCAAGHLDFFKGKIGASVDTPALPTGFARLDAVLDGGLFEGFYVVGGISSLGKTTLVVQLADQVARSGRDVLIFSLEMARSELMAKSLSRLTLTNALQNGLTGASAKTARGLTCGSRYGRYSGAELRLIGLAIEEYEQYAGRLFISEGVGDIGAGAVRLEVEKHLRLTGHKPLVIIDYLQILAPPSERATDKQNTDKNVLELKRLSRDYKIPVIGLSSFNRANYREAVTMEAFKESGAIEYSSDVLLGLQLKGAGEKDFDALAEKDKNPRRVELVVLKNRQGPAGGRIDFEYYPQFNYFKECLPI